VGVAVNHIGYTVGLSLTSGSNAALVFATAPVWGLLLGVALRLERANVRGVLGLGLALLGVTLVVYEGLGAEEASLSGDLLVLLSAACWGAYAVLSLPMLKRLSPLVVAAYSMLFGGLVVLVLSLPALIGMNWRDIGAGAWAGALYSTLFASAFAVAAWQAGVSRIGANQALVYLYLVTLVGVVSSALLLDEALGPLKLLGGALILACVYLVRRAKPLPKSAPEPTDRRTNEGGGDP
jgi:drug/metabolite transporter (DMT)-like permease